MSEPKKSATTEPAGAGEAQAKMDKETDQGYAGSVPDPTPNENYTVGGVTSGKPTPETDEKLRDEVRKNLGGTRGEA